MTGRELVRSAAPGDATPGTGLDDVGVDRAAARAVVGGCGAVARATGVCDGPGKPVTGVDDTPVAPCPPGDEDAGRSARDPGEGVPLTARATDEVPGPGEAATAGGVVPAVADGDSVTRWTGGCRPARTGRPGVEGATGARRTASGCAGPGAREEGSGARATTGSDEETVDAGPPVVERWIPVGAGAAAFEGSAGATVRAATGSGCAAGGPARDRAEPVDEDGARRTGTDDGGAAARATDDGGADDGRADDDATDDDATDDDGADEEGAADRGADACGADGGAADDRFADDVVETDRAAGDGAADGRGTDDGAVDDRAARVPPDGELDGVARCVLPADAERATTGRTGGDATASKEDGPPSTTVVARPTTGSSGAADRRRRPTSPRRGTAVGCGAATAGTAACETSPSTCPPGCRARACSGARRTTGESCRVPSPRLKSALRATGCNARARGTSAGTASHE
ncbi:hypothetical protein ASD16_05935 [Cellulomonas sp. Root485]|nr:hypothetical protein ASD16_05935 [Cellulomonas sp. Root485]